MIDAHQHFWRLELGADGGPFDYAWLQTPAHAPICRDRLPEDLAPMLRNAGVARTVLVQTQHRIEENRWALDLAEQHAFIAGVVGWVDLRAADVEDQLAEFKDHPKFVGVRHIVQDEPDEDWVVRAETLRGLEALEKHQVPYDLLFYPQHLRHAPVLADRFGDLPMVIDHLAKPRIRDRVVSGWLDELKAAAERENLFCKLSGLITEADWSAWSAEDLRPYVQAALEAFGPERCMFGSDWPVCELAGRYDQVIEALDTALGPISENERQAIFGGTAQRFYRLAD